MPLQSYQLTAEVLEDGNRYAVVTLEDGSTFGQIVEPGEIAQIDRQIEAAASRYEAALSKDAPPQIAPVTRTAAEIEASA